MVWETMRHLAANHSVTVVGTNVEAVGIENVSVSLVANPRGPRALAPIRWRRAAGRRLEEIDHGVTVSYGVNCPVGDVLVVQSVHRAWLELGRSVPCGRFELPAKIRYVLPRHRILLALEASYFASSQAQRVVAVSENVATDLRRFYAVPNERIVVVPNGYSREQCSPERSAHLREEMRAKVGLSPTDIAILLVANEWHRKGLRVLLEATALLRDHRVQILLVGRMAPDAYQRQIEDLGLGRRVHYCGPSRDVALFHAAADLFVMPTQYEAFGSVIVEALASGLPVITTSCAGAAIAVKPDINGLLQQDPDDANELAELLHSALDPDTRTRWSRAAAQSVTDYQWPMVMAQMERVIEEVAP